MWYTNPIDAIVKIKAHPELYKGIYMTFGAAAMEIDFGKVAFVDNVYGHALNFGPLGVHKKDTDKVRFSTVWYFDDKPTRSSWSRGWGMGTILVRAEKILLDTTNNDFYNYLLTIDSEDAKYFLENWVGKKVDASVVDANEAKLQKLLDAFFEYWAESGEADTSYSKTPSFGSSATLKVQADKYYYKTNENNEYIMEYSAVIPLLDKEARVINISYVSYVKSWNYGYYAPHPTNPHNVFLLKQDKEIHRLGDIE